MSDISVPIRAQRSPFRHRPFRLLFTTRATANTANQMQAVAVGWLVYDLTGSALNLGLIGLVQFIPPLCLTLLAGQVVDHYSRATVLRVCYVVELTVSLGLLALAAFSNRSVPAIFALLFVNAIARTFEGPALQSLLPSTVPRDVLMQAVSVNASVGKISQLIGPALGGLLYGFGVAIDFGLCALLVVVAAVASFLLTIPPAPEHRPAMTWSSAGAGMRFIWRQPIVFGAMSLDLAATLFGGVTALLPIFAGEILHIGPLGFGILRSAPATGGLITAVLLARLPITRAAGLIMFSGIAIYGLATIAFGLSTATVLSICALLAVGAADMASTVVRHSLIQFATPDAMRGRVFAMNTLFVNSGGQLGMFESGVTAAWFGAVGSAVLGGTAVLALAIIWAWRFPGLRRVEQFDEVSPDRRYDA
jgi:MFS family permease